MTRQIRRKTLTVSEYKRIYLDHEPCAEGMEAFSRCYSRKDAYELALSPLACDFFLKSIRDGWGPTPDDIEAVFGPYLGNGYTPNYNTDSRQVRCQMWCKCDRVSVDDSIRMITLVGCRGRVDITGWQVIKILVDSNSDIDLYCSDNSIVLVENYGGVVRDKNGNAKIKDYGNI